MMQMLKVVWVAATSSENDVPVEVKKYTSIGFAVRETEDQLVLSQSVDITPSGVSVNKNLSLPKLAIISRVQLQFIPEVVNPSQGTDEPTESTQSESQENATDETPDAA
jgi:hypothetical protein